MRFVLCLFYLFTTKCNHGARRNAYPRAHTHTHLGHTATPGTVGCSSRRNTPDDRSWKQTVHTTSPPKLLLLLSNIIMPQRTKHGPTGGERVRVRNGRGRAAFEK